MVTHDHTFGVYKDVCDVSFKIGMSSFKFNHKHVFVDGKKHKATQSVCELLTKSKADRNLVSMQNKPPYKQIPYQSNAHSVHYTPSGKIKANKGLMYTPFISQLFTNTKEVLWESLQ